MAVPPFSVHVGAYAQMTEMGIMDNVTDMIGMCIEHADEIGLTDDQIMKIKPMCSEFGKREARFKADLRIAEIELLEIMEVKDFSMDHGRSAVEKMAEIKKAHHFEMLRSARDMRAVFTEQQFREISKMLALKTHA